MLIFSTISIIRIPDERGSLALFLYWTYFHVEEFLFPYRVADNFVWLGGNFMTLMTTCENTHQADHKFTAVAIEPKRLDCKMLPMFYV